MGRIRKKSDASTEMIVIIEKNTDKFLTAPITNADIRQPTMFEHIRIAQKVPLNSPLLLSLAQIATYFACASHKIDAPNPFNTAAT